VRSAIALAIPRDEQWLGCRCVVVTADARGADGHARTAASLTPSSRDDLHSFLPSTTANTVRKRSSRRLAISLVVLGLLIPVVPRLVTRLTWPHWEDDSLVHTDLLRLGLLVLWNALPFVVLALVAYIALTRPAAGGRPQATVLGGVVGALIPGLVVGIWIHTPDPSRVGFNFGVAFFPLYMLVLMPAGFGFGALLGRYTSARVARR
jgi:hypothetical protein